MRLRILIFLAAFLLAAFLPASAQSTPPLAGIAHVAFRVRDLAASIAFYQGLGFERAFDLQDNDGKVSESFLKINDRQFLELYPVTQKEPAPGFLHLCFEGEDLEAVHDDYLAHGLLPKEIRKAGAGNLLFTMWGPKQPLGPGGGPLSQNIEYTEYQPGSLHMEDTGKHLGGDRIADRLLSVSLAMSDAGAARMFYLNDLSFKPLPGDQFVLHLPGNSGQQIEIVAPTLGAHGRITLQTQNLGRAARRLGHEHIKFVKSAELLAFTDLDGNQILIQQR